MDRPNIPRHTVGTHDNGPLSQEYYKRAVYQSAPRCFEVDSLPPRKFGRSYRFGLRIYPILGDRVSTSSEGTTSDSTSDYEIWRSWDDCLWFQDSLELRYGVLSREKRHRLQAGKGVKKNGMYIHDRASSFESLPPGPDPRSVAKSIHGYLPKLTKRGTFFRASQETVVQRRMELDAFLEAFLRKDVPTLIQELRQDRVILDFFGYWRRDHDLATKMSAQQPAIAPGDSVGTRSLSSFFSGSIVSFPAPHTPLSPASSSSMRSASLPQPRHTADPIVPLSDAGSTFSDSTIYPQSAPARTTFPDSVASEDGYPTHGRKISTSSSNPSSPSVASSRTFTSRNRASSHGSKSSSPRSETFNVTSDFPLFLSSSTRDLLPSSRSPHSPTYATPALGTLPEDCELGPSVPILPSPIPRARKDRHVNVDRANRHCVVWKDADDASSNEGDDPERELRTPVDGADLHVAVAKSTSNSSMSSSLASSNLSSPSRCPCSSTSSECTRVYSVHSDDSHVEIEFPYMASTDTFSESECSIFTPRMTGRSSTLPRSFSARRRSLSQPLAYAALVPTDVDETQSVIGEGEDTMDAYFGGTIPFYSPNEEDFPAYCDTVPDDSVLDVPLDSSDSPIEANFPIPRQKNVYIDGPPGSFHHLHSPPRSPSVASDGVLVVKAVLDDTIVMFRVHCDVSFVELRQLVQEKFARSEGVPLRGGAVALEYVPPLVNEGGKRVSSMSSASTSSADWARALPLRDEEEWTTAVANCGPKISLRATNSTS